MEINEILGKGEKIKGKIRELLGRLTKNERAIVVGKKEQLLGKLRERYHYTHAYAQERLREFIEEFSARGDPLAKKILRFTH